MGRELPFCYYKLLRRRRKNLHSFEIQLLCYAINTLRSARSLRRGHPWSLPGVKWMAFRSPKVSLNQLQIMKEIHERA